MSREKHLVIVAVWSGRKYRKRQDILLFYRFGKHGGHRRLPTSLHVSA